MIDLWVLGAMFIIVVAMLWILETAGVSHDT